MTIAETEIFMVPLNKLTISEKNVRKTNVNDIDDLPASIPVHGLIQNLSVEPAEKDGHFAVVAGGRRLRPLKRLAKEKAIAKDYPVKCSLAMADAKGLSLAENVIRAPNLPDRFFSPAEELPTSPVPHIDTVEACVRNTRAKVSYGGTKVCYRPSIDDILMPDRVCADLGVDHDPRDNTAAYLASWVAVLKDDKRAIIMGAAKAQAAADYLTALQPGAALTAA